MAATHSFKGLLASFVHPNYLSNSKEAGALLSPSKEISMCHCSAQVLGAIIIPPSSPQFVKEMGASCLSLVSILWLKTDKRNKSTSTYSTTVDLESPPKTSFINGRSDFLMEKFCNAQE